MSSNVQWGYVMVSRVCSQAPISPAGCSSLLLLNNLHARRTSTRQDHNNLWNQSISNIDIASALQWLDRQKIVNCISNLLLFLCSCQWCATNDKESLTSHYQSPGNPAEQTWRSSKEYRRTIPANVPHSLTLSAQILRPPYQCLRLTLTGTSSQNKLRVYQ